MHIRAMLLAVRRPIWCERPKHWPAEQCQNVEKFNRNLNKHFLTKTYKWQIYIYPTTVLDIQVSCTTKTYFKEPSSCEAHCHRCMHTVCIHLCCFLQYDHR